VIPPQRCAFPGCGRRLEFAPVEGVTSSVRLGGVMRRRVCPDHPPVGACSRCGILAGPQYMVKLLIGGRCPDCAGKPGRAAVVIGSALADLKLTTPRIHPRESLPV
jgi:hypothetical protein